MRNTSAGLRTSALSLLFVVYAAASAAQYQVPHRVVASGGAGMGSANYGVQGTVGQTGTGLLAGSSTSARTGYWFLTDNIPTAIDDTPQLPRTFSMDQNFPNPFNPTTTIRFALPQESFVKLGIFNVSGKRVAELVGGVRPAGVYDEVFEASSLASGVYFYRIEAGPFVQVRKLVLLK